VSGLPQQSRDCDTGLSIGMLIIDESPSFLADPLITQVVAGLTNYLGSRGYGVLLQGMQSRDVESSIFLRDARTDGLCVLLSGTDGERRAMLRRFAELGEPVIAFEEPSRCPQANVCVIRQDDFGGGKALGSLLLSRGARRFLMLVSTVKWPSVARRQAGLRASLRKTQAETTFDVIACGNGRFASTQEALGRWIDTHGKPDAVVAANDQMGIAALRLWEGRGLKVSAQVMITGFNGFEFWQYSHPVLTTVRSPAYEMGARAGLELIARLTTGAFSANLITLPVNVQVGGST
jgi:LacI family transcriptional regulator